MPFACSQTVALTSRAAPRSRLPATPAAASIGSSPCATRFVRSAPTSPTRRPRRTGASPTRVVRTGRRGHLPDLRAGHRRHRSPRRPAARGYRRLHRRDGPMADHEVVSVRYPVDDVAASVDCPAPLRLQVQSHRPVTSEALAPTPRSRSPTSKASPPSPSPRVMTPLAGCCSHTIVRPSSSRAGAADESSSASATDYCSRSRRPPPPCSPASSCETRHRYRCEPACTGAAST